MEPPGGVCAAVKGPLDDAYAPGKVELQPDEGCAPEMVQPGEGRAPGTVREHPDEGCVPEMVLPDEESAVWMEWLRGDELPDETQPVWTELHHGEHHTVWLPQ